MHTFSEEGVEIMVQAGVDSVEHGTGLSLDLIDEMARRGTALVPTMINIRTFGTIADQARAKFPGYADHMLALRDRFPSVVRAAHEAGVPIYVGTDAGGGVRHGLAAEEMLLLHEAGIPAVDVLAARPGGPGSGSASPAWSRAASPTWSSTRRTRARTCGWSGRRSASCCAAGSSASRRRAASSLLSTRRNQTGPRSEHPEESTGPALSTRRNQTRPADRAG